MITPKRLTKKQERIIKGILLLRTGVVNDPSGQLSHALKEYLALISKPIDPSFTRGNIV